MTDDTNIDIDWTRHNFPAKGHGQVVLKEFQIQQPHNIIFYNGSSPLEENEVMRITKDGITANPAFPPDEAAAAVLRALSGQIKRLTQRTWVGLTDEEIYKAEEGAWYMDELDKIIYAKNIEAKLKEKNT